MPNKGYHAVRITITDMDGTVLDTFPVSHWQEELPCDDSESVGSRTSEGLLMHRIKREMGLE